MNLEVRTFMMIVIMGTCASGTLSIAALRPALVRFIAQHEDGPLSDRPGTGKSHLAQAIGRAVIPQGYRVRYREEQMLQS